MPDTLNLAGVTLNVVYVDPSLATAGDGTTPAGALKTIGTPASGNAYIVRRLDGTASSLTAVSLSVAAGSLAIIGMARPGTPEYALMPTAAKAAWGSDTGRYAILTMAAAAAALVTLANNMYVGYFHGLQLSGIGSGDAYFLNLSCRYSSIVTDCKFFPTGMDLSAESYTSLPTETTAATIGGVSITAYANYSTNAFSVTTIRDCVFCIPGASSNKRHAIYLTGSQLVQASITNNVFYYTTGSTAAAATATNYGVYINTTLTTAPATPYYNKTINICGNTVNILVRANGTAQWIPSCWNLSPNFGPLRFTNNTVQVASRRLGGSTYGAFTIAASTVSISAPQLFMDNNTVNLSPTDWVLTLAANVVSIDCNNYAPARLARLVSYINTLMVNVGANGGDTTTTPSNAYFALRLYWAAAAIDGLLVVSNLSVTAEKRRALSAQYCHFSSAITLVGAMTSANNIGRIASLTSTQFCGALLSTSNDQLVIDALTGNAAGYTGTEYLLSGSIYSSYLYAGACNLPLRNLTPVGATAYGQTFSVSSSSYVTANRYTAASYGMTCDTVAVARTGGASSTLLFSGSCGGYGWLTISPDGFAGIPITPAQTGANVLTMYGLIASGYSEAEASQRLNLSIVVTLANGTKYEVQSRADGQCVTDSSVWGAAGTAVKFTLPFYVPAGATAVLSIEYFNYTSALTLYLDPTRHITAA